MSFRLLIFKALTWLWGLCFRIMRHDQKCVHRISSFKTWLSIYPILQFDCFSSWLNECFIEWLFCTVLFILRLLSHNLVWNQGIQDESRTRRSESNSNVTLVDVTAGMMDLAAYFYVFHYFAACGPVCDCGSQNYLQYHFGDGDSTVYVRCNGGTAFQGICLFV